MLYFFLDGVFMSSIVKQINALTFIFNSVLHIRLFIFSVKTLG